MKCINCHKKIKEGRMFYQDDGILLPDLAYDGFCTKKCIVENVMSMMIHRKRLDYDNIYIPCSGFQCTGSMKADRKNKEWVCNLDACNNTIPFENNGDCE